MKIYLRFGSAILCLALAASLPAVAQDSWADRLKGAIPETPTTPRPLEGAAGPTLGAEHEQLVAGLKEALETGSRRAIEAAGESGGFEDNPDIRIPMPGPLATASGMLRGVGLGRQVDEFEESMNRAAEKAVPEARDIIIEAIRDMSIDDARAILVGPEDGATRFLRRQAEDRIAERFRPIVAESMEETGVTRAFTGLTEQVGTRLPGISAVDELDLNEYVTNETLDGVFTLLAQEEKKIRQDPAARTTELLREVFGN
ncbi:DUF4197 domain-containing protein [Thioalkalivibrio sp.]|uniref:DUF4197 domain-containing protein n=1 Tax=Thioalkalivibrio sp. TaxID=2093813 RepID=UPI0039757CA6